MTCYSIAACTAAVALSTAFAQSSPPQVLVTDYGTHTSIARPGAPRHIVGLKRLDHRIVMDTGVREYGVRYLIAHDDKRPGVGIIGEGYIGMPQPADCNWYGGGFFDLQINGKTIGTTPIHSLTAHRAGNRGQVDFVFDTALSVVRIRFVTIADSDVLYCQALLEPKTEIKSLRVTLKCYPSAYITHFHRRVLTPVRDIAQGERVDLDLAREWWLLYYDRVVDAGHASATRTGVGPCSVLWPGSQATKVAFTVGGYGTRTAMDLKPQRRDFRFIFFDYAGTKNATAIADLRKRADGLLRELPTFPFTDQAIAKWPLAHKQRQIAQMLAKMPDEQAAAQYREWAAKLGKLLKLVQSRAAGAIMAEAAVAGIIQQWDKGLPELRLKALLREF